MRKLAIAALLAGAAWNSPALATGGCDGIGNCNTDNSVKSEGGQGGTGGVGIGTGIGKGGSAESNSASLSGASSRSGASASQSVQGDATKYDSFAFGYAAPGLSVHNNGVYGDETVTLPYGFQVPAIGGGYNDTEVAPTIGFVWRNLPVLQSAYFEDVAATPADRDRAEFRRAFVCAYIPKLANQLTKVSPYRCN